MPFGLALIAGGLSTVNPCGFALLPALLSFYVGADEDDLPRASTRLLQALLVGVAVSAGFLAVFSAVALPISLGARGLTEAIPVGRDRSGRRHGRGRRGGLLRKAGVAVDSSLDDGTARATTKGDVLVRGGLWHRVFGLHASGVSRVDRRIAASRGTLAGLGAFGAYALGMMTVLVALSLGAALLRNGLAHRMRRLLPHMNRITGTFLFLVGLYLAYYWSRARFAAAGSLSEDPLVSFVQTFTNRVQVWAASGGGRWMILGRASWLRPPSLSPSGDRHPDPVSRPRDGRNMQQSAKKRSLVWRRRHLVHDRRRTGALIASGPTGCSCAHTSGNKNWLWLVAAFVLCPCHIPILLAVLGTSALGGALARNSAVVFVALTIAFGLTVWRYLATTKEQDACPACVDESRQTE